MKIGNTEICFGQFWRSRNNEVRYVFSYDPTDRDYPIGSVCVNGRRDRHKADGRAICNASNDLIDFLPAQLTFTDRLVDEREELQNQIKALQEQVEKAHSDLEFWRNLVNEIAYNLGPYRDEAYTSDDGSRSPYPVLLKVPALVSCLAQDAIALQKLQRSVANAFQEVS